MTLISALGGRHSNGRSCPWCGRRSNRRFSTMRT